MVLSSYVSDTHVYQTLSSTVPISQVRPWRPRSPALGSEELELDPPLTSVLFLPIPSRLPIDLLLSMGMWLNSLGRACVAHGRVLGRALLDPCDLFKHPQYPDDHVPLGRQYTISLKEIGSESSMSKTAPPRGEFTELMCSMALDG